MLWICLVSAIPKHDVAVVVLQVRAKSMANVVDGENLVLPAGWVGEDRYASRLARSPERSVTRLRSRIQCPRGREREPVGVVRRRSVTFRVVVLDVTTRSDRRAPALRCICLQGGDRRSVLPCPPFPHMLERLPPTVADRLPSVVVGAGREDAQRRHGHAALPGASDTVASGCWRTTMMCR